MTEAIKTTVQSITLRYELIYIKSRTSYVDQFYGPTRYEYSYAVQLIDNMNPKNTVEKQVSQAQGRLIYKQVKYGLCSLQELLDYFRKEN